MKAAVLYGPNDVRIEDVPEPELVPGGALLRVRACAICGSDAMMYRGDHDCEYPTIMGHEAAGEVVVVADDVSKTKVGDRITFWCHYGCFAEYTCVPTAEVAIGHLAGSVTFEQGGNTQLLCAVMRGVECAELREGDRVLVVGQGPVGLMALQGARAKGAGKTVGTDLHPNRIAMSQRLGADLALDGGSADWPDAVRDQIGEIDVVFDCMTDDGTPDCRGLNQAMRCMRPSPAERRLMLTVRVAPRRLSVNQISGLPMAFQPTGLAEAHSVKKGFSTSWDWACAAMGETRMDKSTGRARADRRMRHFLREPSMKHST